MLFVLFRLCDSRSTGGSSTEAVAGFRLALKPNIIPFNLFPMLPSSQDDLIKPKWPATTHTFTSQKHVFLPYYFWEAQQPNSSG